MLITFRVGWWGETDRENWTMHKSRVSVSCHLPPGLMGVRVTQ